MSYPSVRSELATITKLRKGLSIARLGDGEFKLMDGKGYVREPPNAALAEEMRNVVWNPHPMCVVGIPTMNPASPKYKSWERHKERFARMLSPSVIYYSAFISRPDSAPWIRTRRFAESYASLWDGKRAAIVCEDHGSALRAVRPRAAKTTHIECPTERAYDMIDLLEQAVITARPDIAILSCGPTATCLANRLAAKGIQAIDFGSGGSFLAKLLQ